MKGKVYRTWGSLVLLSATAGTVSAQSLQELYSNALANDTELRAGRAELRAAETQVTEGLSTLRPQLNLEAETGPQYGRSWSGLNDGGVSQQSPLNDEWGFNWDSSTQLVLSQNLYNAQARSAYEAVKQSESASRASLESTRANLLQRVVAGYFDVLQAQEQARLSERVIATVERQLEQTEERHEVGMVAVTDVLEARAALDQAKADQVAADNQLTLARQDLERISGQSVGELRGLRDSFEPAQVELGSREDWVNQSRRNPGIVAARLGIQANEDQLAATRADNLPVVTANASLGYSTDYAENLSGNLDYFDQTNLSFALTATWSLPVYDANARQSRQDRESYNIEARRAEAEGQVRQTELQVRQLYQQLQADLSRLSALKQVVSSRESAAEATQVGYEVGSRNIVEVLDAQQALLSARTDLSLARHSFLRNYIDLQLAAGDLSEDDIGWIMRQLRG